MKARLTPAPAPKAATFALAAALILACFAAAGAQAPAREGVNSSARAAADSLSAKERAEVFEQVWKTIDEKYYDPAFNGVDWKAVGERYRPLVANAETDAAFYELLNRKTLYKSIAVTGTAKESGEDAYVVVLTPEKGRPVTEYVSTKTFLVLRRDTSETPAGGGQPATVVARFSDYRNVGGLLVPHRITYDAPDTGEATVVVKEVKFDTPIPAEVFKARAK